MKNPCASRTDKAAQNKRRDEKNAASATGPKQSARIRQHGLHPAFGDDQICELTAFEPAGQSPWQSETPYISPGSPRASLCFVFPAGEKPESDAAIDSRTGEIVGSFVFSQ
ncbi:hypothetical protein [Comamonas aquatilis]|uniref:hypothetical protein n=1 Tax=Comamonas aquatilis TaxID=1778406 RepID=UPI0039F0CE64